MSCWTACAAHSAIGDRASTVLRVQPDPPAETRRHQIFPTLSSVQIARLRRFGTPRAFASGEYLARAGELSPGVCIVLAGEVVILPRDERRSREPIVVHGPGSFTGELAQLSHHPSLVDAIAQGAVEVIVIPTDRLQAVLVEEAELGELIMRALILRRVRLLEGRVGGPIILGRAANGDVVRLQGFLARNTQPHQLLDPDTDADARALLERFQLDPRRLPMVICPNGSMLHNPHEDDLAQCLGLLLAIDPERMYDVAIVGAGPAGLATAVYAASEGLATLAIDARAFGGQAGASARIENYLGFPTGISGIALMARAHTQAQKFGAEMAIPAVVERLARHPGDAACFELQLSRNVRASARTVVIASGVRYRRLAVPRFAEFESASLHFWASPIETRLCAGEEVVLIGAGNSAGQAVVYLASQAAKITMLVRGAGLGASMSRYLVDRIHALPNVDVHVNAEITALEGDGGVLGAVRWRDRASGAEAGLATRHLFLFIGADPNTAWLSDADVSLDPNGFVHTGADAAGARHPLETSRPGVFAIGDVRCGSVKRVAAAVGEGAQVVAAVHAFLARSA
jgi:thioredoxin reductase (NADPH)